MKRGLSVTCDDATCCDHEDMVTKNPAYPAGAPLEVEFLIGKVDDMEDNFEQEISAINDFFVITDDTKCRPEVTYDLIWLDGITPTT